ncbi:uncharacterized protein LOC131623077 [Vicia villosa]|uniref:uncharacterized protein LOC131623077 n=1 Tax=Vicia villosa TaxID=3911 RepID=UPI00273C5817|nr:uncharacterized protein LOC131623077 [Vicia villosa]
MFCDQFPSLFLLADSSCSKVSDNGFWISGSWNWHINFIGSIDLEVYGDSVESLLTVIGGKKPLVGVDDSFVWWRNSSGFSVRAAYSMILEGKLRGSNIDDNLLKALSGLWKTKIPSKFLIFGWRLLLNRLPTKVNLARRKILVYLSLLLCPFCGLEEETSEHLFASCSVSLHWWNLLCVWLRFDVASFSGNFFARLCCMESLCRSKFKTYTRWLFGMAFCWGVWKCRNEVIFNSVLVSNFDVNGLIKFISWEWFLTSYNGRDSIMWGDWCDNPSLCL